jgi:uncharacterized protein (DUF4415 family)
MRGEVLEVSGEKVSVRLRNPAAEAIWASSKDLRNFSQAARKAWQTAPKRSVGRPVGLGSSRVSVTLRVDLKLWDRFKALEASDLISDRTQVIEKLLCEYIESIEGLSR